MNYCAESFQCENDLFICHIPTLKLYEKQESNNWIIISDCKINFDLGISVNSGFAAANYLFVRLDF